MMSQVTTSTHSAAKGKGITCPDDAESTSAGKGNGKSKCSCELPCVYEKSGADRGDQ